MGQTMSICPPTPSAQSATMSNMVASESPPAAASTSAKSMATSERGEAKQQPPSHDGKDVTAPLNDTTTAKYTPNQQQQQQQQQQESAPIDQTAISPLRLDFLHKFRAAACGPTLPPAITITAPNSAASLYCDQPHSADSMDDESEHEHHDESEHDDAQHIHRYPQQQHVCDHPNSQHTNLSGDTYSYDETTDASHTTYASEAITLSERSGGHGSKLMLESMSTNSSANSNILAGIPNLAALRSGQRNSTFAEMPNRVRRNVSTGSAPTNLPFPMAATQQSPSPQHSGILKHTASPPQEDAQHLQAMLQGYQTRIKYLEQKEILTKLQLKGYECSIDDYKCKMQTMQAQLQKQEAIIARYEDRLHRGNGLLTANQSMHSVNSMASISSSASQHLQTATNTSYMNLSNLQQWLFDEGTKSNKVQPWMIQYCQKLRDYNIPIDRLFITNVIPHDPTFYMYGWVWEYNEPFTQFKYTKQQFDAKLHTAPQDECFHLLYTNRKKRANQKRKNTKNLDSVLPGNHWTQEQDLKQRVGYNTQQRRHMRRSSLGDVQRQQYTHYFSLPIYQNDKFMGSISWVTKNITGFSKYHLQFFQQSMAGLALIVRYQTNEANQETLMKRMEDTVHQRTQELAAANAKLQNANRHIQQQSQAQLRHFAMMSHEIRTPLNCIIGLSGLLVKDASLTQDQQEALKMITTSGDLLLHVVDDVLNFSKLAVGEVVFHMAPISLRDTLRTVFHNIQQQQQHVRLRVSTPQPLPCRIVMDTRRLQQVLYNLLGNAVKFGRDGKYVDCTITQVGIMMDEASDEQSANVRREMQMLQFDIQDYGVGIHPDHMANIFQPFRQLSVDTEREYGGTGLGLAITSNLVKAMGGRIDVQSECGKWCKFTVQMPLTLPDEDMEGSMQMEDVAPASALRQDRFQLSNNFLEIHELSKIVQMETDKEELPPPPRSTPNMVERTSLISLPPPNHEQLLQDLDKMLQEQQDGSSSYTETTARFARPDATATPKSQALNHEQLMNYLDRIGKQQSQRSLIPETAKNEVTPASDAESMPKEDAPTAKPPPVIVTSSKPIKSTRPKMAAADQPVPKKARAGDGASSPWKALKVLVAEDNKVNQKVCKRILTRIGITDIDIMDNGQKAVDQEQKKAYDLVLMDLEMPVMNGLDATKHIIRRRNELAAPLPRVLFLSAHALEEYKTQAREAGADGFLSKPFRIEAIETSLKELKFDGTQAMWTTGT